MARSNVGIEELKRTLEKSGLPMSDSFMMRQAQPYARDAIRGNVGDHGAGEAMNSYKTKLAQIAQMDQKLAGVYSDPTSNLYIEHAGQRDNAMFSPRNTQMQELGDIEQRRQNALAMQEAEMKEAEDTYYQLENTEKELEAELKRQEKENKKGSGKGSSGGGTTGKVRLTSARIEEIDKLGIDHDDVESIEMLYLGMSTAERKKLIQRVTQGKPTITKGDYWNADRLKYETSAYSLGVLQGKDALAKSKKKSTSSSGGKSTLELMEEYKKIKSE